MPLLESSEKKLEEWGSECTFVHSVVSYRHQTVIPRCVSYRIENSKTFVSESICSCGKPRGPSSNVPLFREERVGSKLELTFLEARETSSTITETLVSNWLDDRLISPRSPPFYLVKRRRKLYDTTPRLDIFALLAPLRMKKGISFS